MTLSFVICLYIIMCMKQFGCLNMSPDLRKISVLSTLGPFRKMSKKSSTYRLISRMVKSPALSAIAIATILLFIYAGSLTSHHSINTANIKAGQVLTSPQTMSTPLVGGQEQVATSLNSLPVAISTSSEGNIEGETENEDPLIPPVKASVDERIEWFRRKLPELEILQSNGLSEKFHGQVLEFFNKDCSAQFFMVWLSAQPFGPREFLAVDSLFSTSPDGCLLILSNSMDTPKGFNILKPLVDRGFNVLAVTPDVPFLLKNTPAEAWLEELKSGNMDPGSIPLFNHLSDLIRLAVLYKYGGIYLDTDFIFLKDLSGFKNAIGAQSINQVTKKWTRLNGAVMIFDINHPLLLEFLKEYAATFNGNRWGHNGSYLVSRVLERIGEDSEYNITILPPRAFFPVDWIKIAKFFKKPETDADSEWADYTLADISSESYVVHLWNKRSRELKIEEGSAMARLTAEHCNVCDNIYDL